MHVSVPKCIPVTIDGNDALHDQERVCITLRHHDVSQGCDAIERIEFSLQSGLQTVTEIGPLRVAVVGRDDDGPLC